MKDFRTIFEYLTPATLAMIIADLDCRDLCLVADRHGKIIGECSQAAKETLVSNVGTTEAAKLVEIAKESN